MNKQPLDVEVPRLENELPNPFSTNYSVEETIPPPTNNSIKRIFRAFAIKTVDSNTTDFSRSRH